ncbi:hypothetical protein [Jiella pacifica]|uniref:Uncharacterized protein n=1 Tax=Jiella pacifica TaxID=2696469 RepID=A0A6N9T5M5_9HYPH|nr:hypothetical protein [Jiella pacifica]NDW06673.1 hypothetical protein [Jiella pacifica]
MKNCHLSAESAAAFTGVRIWGDRKLASAYAPEKTIGSLSRCRHELTLNLPADGFRRRTIQPSPPRQG